MRIRVAVPDDHVTPDVVEPVLEAVTRLNQHMLVTGQTPTATELVRQGAIWRPENMGDEHFDHGGTIASRGWGNCDDWGPLRAADLRVTGEDPGARVVMKPSGPSTFHAMVERSGGAVETGNDDISVKAGMKMHNISGAEDSPAIWLCDPHDGRIRPSAGARPCTRAASTSPSWEAAAYACEATCGVARGAGARFAAASCPMP